MIPKNKFVLTLIILFVVFNFQLNTFAKDIEIGLLTTKKPVKIGSDQNGILINLNSNEIITKINKRETYLVSNSNGLIKVSQNITKPPLASSTRPIKLIPEKQNGLVFCNKHWYRVELIILTNKDKQNITLVNKLDLEDYLLSVVPSEIPNHWIKEALKAQSIAARSYALGYLNRRRSKGYDLESSIEDQLYLGVASERKSTTEAVKETIGEVLLDKDNKPLIALYHSSGGGYTDSIENLWDQKPSIHIQPRPDYDDKSPYFKWNREYKLTEINNLLSSLTIGNVVNITPLSRSISQRVTWVEITGTKSKAIIRGEEFRKLLNLPSSKFNFLIEQSLIKFAGRGFGHGLGMSQWGSKALAEKGFSHKEILAHYYPGTKLAIVPDDF